MMIKQGDLVITINSRNLIRNNINSDLLFVSFIQIRKHHKYYNCRTNYIDQGYSIMLARNEFKLFWQRIR